MPTDRRIARMRRVLENRQTDLTVVCENIHDPHNVSAILRSCDAVGIETVRLLYNTTAFPKLGKKSSASAKKWIETVPFGDAESLRDSLKSQSFIIYATHLEAEAVSIHDIDWTQPSAIVVGNEHNGVSESILAIADRVVYVPMFGMIQSLNVSVATAVILYEACRQRSIAGCYPNARRTATELQKLLDNWKEK